MYFPFLWLDLHQFHAKMRLAFSRESNLQALTNYMHPNDHLPMAHRPVVLYNSELYKWVATVATGLVAMIIFRSFIKTNRQRVLNLLWRRKRLTTANRMTAPPSDTNRDSMLKFPWLIVLM